MVAAIFDKDFVRIVACDDHACDIQPWNRCLERIRIVLRYSSLHVDGHSALAQKIEARRKTRHEINAVGFQALFAPSLLDHDVTLLDRLHASIPPHPNRAFLCAVRKIWKYPRLDLLVERWAEVHEGHACARAPKIECGFRRRIPSADDDSILEKRFMALVIDVRYVRQVLSGHSDAIWRAKVS